MTSKTPLRVASFISVLASVFLAACAPGSEGTGGTTGSGGGGSGGASSGGATSTGSGGATSTGSGGATSAGGASTGGANTGGTSSGGTSSGGRGSGGQLGTGGSASGGGMGTGGRASGGAGTGGAGNGGSVGTGGAAGGPVVGVSSPENAGAACAVTAGALKKNTKLPDPFAMHDGTRITTKAQWECRRNEVKKDLEKYEIGPKQDRPTVAATLSGSTLSVKITTTAGTMTLTSAVSGSGSCVAIGMNGASSLISGCTQIPFMHDQVVISYQNSTQNKTDPFYKVYPDLFGKIGNYSAWSWGISRLIDGIEQVKDQLKVDVTKIGVQGCSYAGKMALFAGALDERVALTIAEESGGGGITSWRTSQDFNTRTGTSVEKIDNTNFGWFMASMKTLDPYSLPHDHHELIAMIAPRAVVAMGNADYDWLGDESGYKSIMAAAEVFKAWGIADHIGYDFTSGHGHCAPPAVQVASAKTFVDRFLKGTSTTSNVTIKPTSTKFNLDYASVIDWTTPTLQ